MVTARAGRQRSVRKADRTAAGSGRDHARTGFVTCWRGVATTRSAGRLSVKAMPVTVPVLSGLGFVMVNVRVENTAD